MTESKVQAVAVSVWQEVVKQLLAECAALEDHMLPAVSRRTPEYYTEDAEDDADGELGEEKDEAREQEADDDDSDTEQTPKPHASGAPAGTEAIKQTAAKAVVGARTVLARTPLCVVVCSWRTVREVSLLLAQLTCITVPTPNGTTSTTTNTTTLLNDSQILTIGAHFARLLLVARHMGAFESGYIGYLKFTLFLWRCAPRHSLSTRIFISMKYCTLLCMYCRYYIVMSSKHFLKRSINICALLVLDRRALLCERIHCNASPEFWQSFAAGVRIPMVSNQTKRKVKTLRPLLRSHCRQLAAAQGFPIMF